jgi:hypothetical protein
MQNKTRQSAYASLMNFPNPWPTSQSNCSPMEKNNHIHHPRVVGPKAANLNADGSKPIG